MEKIKYRKSQWKVKPIQSGKKKKNVVFYNKYSYLHSQRT